MLRNHAPSNRPRGLRRRIRGRCRRWLDDIPAAAECGRLALAKRPDYIAELEAKVRERALVYKTLVLTGLRKGELASLTIGQLDLDAPQPDAILNAADEKNRKGSEIPLRPDVSAGLVR